MTKTVFYHPIVLLAMVMLTCTPLSADDSAIKMVHIKADEAFEDVRPDILHFSGNFFMQSHDWQLESARATVYGQLDKPDKVHLEGSPARFRVIRNENQRLQTVEASAPTVRYQRSTNTLELFGGSKLELDGEVISSREIVYHISTDRYLAVGFDGVKIEVPPDD